MVGFEKVLGAVKVTKDQIQYRSQSLLNLARGYFRMNGHRTAIKKEGQSLLHGQFHQPDHSVDDMSENP